MSNVPITKTLISASANGFVSVAITPTSVRSNCPEIRAYQLLHVALHELGHHHDRMTTKSKRRASRGEGFAERHALNYGDRIWERYLEAFGLPQPIVVARMNVTIVEGDLPDQEVDGDRQCLEPTI